MSVVRLTVYDPYVWDMANGFSNPGAATGRRSPPGLQRSPRARQSSVSEHDGWKPAVIGNGDSPLPEVRSALRQVGYDGFVSFEWGKKRHLDIADANTALPHFTCWFREYCEP